MGLYKTECVYGPDTDGWDDVDELELATLSWVHWFNHQRLRSHCGDVPPVEFEAAWHQQNMRATPGSPHSDETDPAPDLSCVR